MRIRPDLNINIVDIESLTIEILSENKRNTLVKALYRPPNGQIESFEAFLNNIFPKIKSSNKLFHTAGDFSLYLLNHDTNTKVKRFLNLVYRNGMIPTINKPARVTRKTATAMDHILTNSFCDTVFKTTIYKCDVSDHFPIYLIIPSPSKQENVTETTFITKRILNTKLIELFKQKLYETSWDEMEMSQNPDQAYKTFLTKFSDLYNIYLAIKIIKVKNKDLNSPWITKGLYEKVLKNSTEKHELAYKTYKRLFESIKKHSKKLHLSNLTLKYKNNIKKAREVIKESIGKRNCHDQNFPKKIVVDGKDITDEELIAKCFNKYFAEIGPKLAKNIQKSSTNFESFMKTCDSTQAESALTIN